MQTMQTMQTIFLFIPQYVYASDLLRTRRFLEALGGRFRVFVFAPPVLLSGGEPYARVQNVEYIAWPLQRPKFWILFGKFLRFSLIRTYDFEPVVQRRRAKGMGDWRRSVLRALSHGVPRRWMTNDFFTSLETALYPRSREFEALVARYRPLLVATPTPGFTHYCAEALILAKKAGLPTVAVDFSWDNLHNGGVHFRRPDYLIVWNENIKQVAVAEYGMRVDHVFVSGIIRFDHYSRAVDGEMERDVFLRSKGLDPREKTVLLTTVTAGNYTEEPRVLADLIAARERGVFPGYPNIFVRMHPKEYVRTFEPFMRGSIRNFHIERGGTPRPAVLRSTIELTMRDLVNLKDTLRHADVVVNYASTMTLEAFVFDRPVVNIGYPKEFSCAYTFRHYKPIVDADAVRLAGSFEELCAHIRAYLADPSLDRAERARVRERFVPWGDGLSYARTTSAIEEMVKREHNRLGV